LALKNVLTVSAFSKISYTANEVVSCDSAKVVRVLWYFLFFLVSGFCGILYELVWLRLAMAQFGVTTPLVSMVLSMFMAGLGIGSWGTGLLIKRYGSQSNFNPLRLYALSEFLIGVSALLVPMQLVWGHRILERLSGQAGISSGANYLFSGIWLAFTMVPWCAAMGATIPLAMSAIRRERQSETRRSFSFLYLANLMGAVAGAILPLAFIEVLGFRGTLRVGTVLNFAVAIAAILVSLKATRTDRAEFSPVDTAVRSADVGSGILVLLFLTGLTTMSMEVVWIRLFTPSIGPMVYSFALILASYLFATFYGSRVYRFWSREHSQESGLIWVSLSLLGLLPLLAVDLRVSLAPAWRVFLGVAPFSGVIGFLTSMLVDRWSQGDPSRAGRAYAVNILGCILGPLLGGFLLLPLVGERLSLLICVLPFIAIPAFSVGGSKLKPLHRVLEFAVLACALFIFFWTNDFESRFPRRLVLRDSAATVIAATEGVDTKILLVNGVGMTGLSLITKMMAHLTLASHEQPPQDTLIICFGMGTTFRSGLSWGIPTTVVDLIPSVPKLFPYYHRDARQVVASPLAHVIVDDGRRFLERSSQTFDSIIVDPPPPVPAAGSSLLYSVEFYGLVKEHLRRGGIFQQWLPEGDRATQAAVARALKNSFPFIRVFQYRGQPGWHFLASFLPIPVRTSSELALRMPSKALADLTEWGPSNTPAKQFDLVLGNEVTLESLIRLAPETPALQDDRPINEYYFLRTPCLTCQPAIEYVRQHLNSGVSKILAPSVATSLQ
jgi:predicted membrane-bound spermidine synthase